MLTFEKNSKKVKNFVGNGSAGALNPAIKELNSGNFRKEVLLSAFQLSISAPDLSIFI